MDKIETEFPVLIAQSGPLNGNRWVLDNSIVIGRDSTCQVVIPDRQVSRYHARLTASPDGVQLEDLGSKNGTFCNGQRLSESVTLQDGDLVQIALIQHFVYLSSDATIPLEGGEAVLPEARKMLYIETRSRRVWVGKQELDPPLSVPQFKMLLVLYEHEGQVVSRQELIAEIWGDEMVEGVSEQALDALVRRLRDRVSLLDPTHNYIVTIRGHGLRLENRNA